MTQGFDRFEAAGAPRGRESGEAADDERAGADHDDVAGNDQRRQFVKGVDLRGK